jgi:hypothetical protein
MSMFWKHTSTRCCLFPICFVGLISFQASQADGQLQGPSSDSKQVLEAWRKRTEGSSSLDFVAVGEQYEPKQEYDRNRLIHANAKNLEPFTLPEKTFPVSLRYSLSPTKARTEYRGQMVSVEQREYVDYEGIDVYDGKIRKSFIGKNQMTFPGASFSKDVRKTVAVNTGVIPLLLLYRAVSDDLPQFEPAKLFVDGAKVPHDGRECVLIRHDEKLVWVDPSRDFIPLRYQEHTQGKLRQTIDIKYRRDEKLGWVPSGWTNAEFYGPEHLIRSLTVHVTDAHVGEPLPDDFYDLPPLPDGTWVSNVITNEDYILQAGGKRRDVKPGEFDGDNYQQLLHSDPPGHNRRWPLIALLISVPILLVTVFVIRRYRRRSTAPIH